MKSDIEIEQFLIYLRGSVKKMQKVFNEELKTFDISSCHLVYMMLLRRRKLGLTMTELSNMSQVDKALTSRVMKELERKEYIYRDTDNKHLRNYNICLTDKGFDIANSIDKIMNRNKQKILAEFSDSEQKQIYEVIIILMNKFNIKEEE